MIELIETDIRGPDCQTWAIRCDGLDPRPWLHLQPICELLSQYHILHLGVALMPAPFQIVRTHLGGSYFLASLGGEGKVLVDGKWTVSCPGQAFLLPPKTLHAFFTPSGKTWRFAWIRYQEAPGQKPIARANSPVVASFEAAPLEMAILGLYHECRSFSAPPMAEQWLRIIHGYVQRFATPTDHDPRMWKTWEMVAQRLDHPWSISDLAREACLSEKQFQRLCKKDLGRSPQQQLMWLRICKAAEMLASGDKKIQSIALAVGYHNPFAFSSTFKRMIGWSPSEYSRRQIDSSQQPFPGEPMAGG